MARQLKILVAEDDPDDVFLLKRAFAKGGVQAPMDFVKDGQEAIDYLQEKPLVAAGTLTPTPTMLILDLEAYALGADNYAVKPSDPSEMMRLAQRLKAQWSGKNTTASSDPFTA